MRDGLQAIIYVDLQDDTWIQASLPVSERGIGVRKFQDLSVPGFISSSLSTEMLVDTVLHNTGIPASARNRLREVAQEEWTERSRSAEEPEDSEKSKQKPWDFGIVKTTLNGILQEENQIDVARILEANAQESGQWLHAIPVPSLGIKLDAEQLRIGITLPIDARICQAHKCRCGRVIDPSGWHGSSCTINKGED